MMISTRSRIALTAAVAVLLVTALTACKAKPASVASVWPTANSERATDKPAEPLRWPLAGTPAPDEASLKQRPLSIKIENSPEARPQTGLNEADVVYESVTEGGITRFNCIFQSDVPATVGPVRSARLSDLWVVPQYHGLFFFSGASSSVNAAVKGANLPNLSEDAGVSYPYFRSKKRNPPHNLFLDTAKAVEEALKRGMATTVDVPALQHDLRSFDGTVAVSSVYIPFSPANTVLWTFDAKSKRYLRENNGKKHFDALDNRQVAAKNIVVLWAKYTPRSHDVVGSTTYDITLGGSGRVSIFHDGQRFDGTWEATKDAPPRFKTADGRAIKLAPGNTWFQIVPLTVNITLK